MMTSNEIRKAFLDFFESKGHKIVPSAPIVVKNDPTLMFINSGMAPFKDIFLGNKPIQYPRVADTQKCLRVSGKHNDLEEVGVDTYHHTLFEMLGNWSFGDYFKKDAIAWSWELLTEVYKLPKDRLYVTVFEGDPKENLAFDQESYDEWKKWIAEDRILKGNKKDNFWEMGDTGPCGPCSEIHIDLRSDEERKKIDGKTLVNESHPQVIEIWNNVFMEFNRKADGSLEKLPAQHVDTGMGFERLCMAIQGKQSNYDTDVFQPTISIIAEKANIPYTGSDSKQDIAMRVIADHIRAISFTIADGQLPSSNGAGYVIRRILRRAVRYGYSYLGFDKPFLNELVPQLAMQFAAVFPEIKTQESFITNVIREEENSFLKTLANGIKRLNAIEEEMKATGSKEISGKVAFELFDTYGFPLDLTQLIASEKNLTVDTEGFKTEMAKQKENAKKAAATEQSDWVNLQEDANTEFIGYDYSTTDAQLVKYRTVKQKDKEVFQLVLDKTPFYAESGGQVGDTGILYFGDEKIEVVDTKKENDLIVHFTKKLPADPRSEVKAIINTTRRNNTIKNHSATHLLQAALRQVLGTHVEQRGSFVNDDLLRFDFSHFAKMTDEEIAKTEQIVNEKIMANIPLDERRNVPVADAKKMGATALFGEKYGEFVRVITFDENYSRELCGGTHVQATGEIGLFKIIAESSIQAGVRRIEALTGKNAIAYVNEKLNELSAVKAAFNNPKNLQQTIDASLTENATLKKTVEGYLHQQIVAEKNSLLKKVQTINGIQFIGEIVLISNAEALKDLVFMLKNELKNYVVAVAAAVNGKVSLHIMIDENIVKEKGWQANQWIKEIVPLIKGGGGGQPFYATAGGADVSKIAAAIDAVKNKLQ